MSKSNGIRSITADIAYPSIDANSNSFRVYISKNLTGNWVPCVLIISRGEINPLENFSDTYDAVSSFLDDYKLRIDKCNVYLDLMEYLGVHTPYLFHWNISNRTNLVKNYLKNVDFYSISNEDKKILQQYYKSKWSSFLESCLTNDDKIKLFADLISNSVYDDISAERLQDSFRYKLLDSIRKGSDFKWQFDSQYPN